MFTFREEPTDNAEQMRYYLQTGGNKNYLMVSSNGSLISLNATDLALGSQNDTRSRFRIVYVL